MSDLERLVTKWKAEDSEFAEAYERGYEAFKIGVLLRQAREDAGMTQQQVAERLGTKKSAISRLENNAGDMRLSTLQRYAEAVGCRLVLELRPDSEAAPARTRVVAASRALVAADTDA